jgi:putative hemolysin
MQFSILLFFILLCCSAFFSSSETALFSLSRIQIHKFRSSKNRAAQAVVSCLRRPRHWLATILLGNELVNVLISIIGASIINHYFPYSMKWKTVMAILIVTPVVLIFGEILPKNLAIRHAPVFATLYIYPLGLFHKIVKPLRVFLTKFADRMVIFFGGHPEKLHPMVMEEEFRRLVDLGRQEGVIVEEEREMIHKVFDFTDKNIATIITPVEKIFSLSVERSYEDILEQLKNVHFSRVPIYEEDLSNIIGILHVRDLFLFHRKRQAGGAQSIRSILRRPIIISPERKLETLLQEFKRERVHMAIVKENGQVKGLVTMDDVLEEIFGEIEK